MFVSVVRHDDAKDQVSRLAPLGRGTYGTVYHLSSSDTALKAFHSPQDEENYHGVLRELGSYRLLNDVIPLAAAVRFPYRVMQPTRFSMLCDASPMDEEEEDEDRVSTGHRSGTLMALMEMPVGMTIDPDRVMTLPQLRHVAFDMLCALGVIHAAGLIHRDVKPDNILRFVIDGKLQYRLSDLGLARFITDAVTPLVVADEASDPKCSGGIARLTNCDIRNVLTGEVYTRSYRPPELRNAAYALGPTTYGPEADVWALGMTLLHLALGSRFVHPRSTAELEAQHRALLCGWKDKQTFGVLGEDEQGMAFVRTLLMFEPAERTSIQDALVHPFFEPHMRLSRRQRMASRLHRLRSEVVEGHIRNIVDQPAPNLFALSSLQPQWISHVLANLAKRLTREIGLRHLFTALRMVHVALGSWPSKAVAIDKQVFYSIVAGALAITGMTNGIYPDLIRSTAKIYHELTVTDASLVHVDRLEDTTVSSLCSYILQRNDGKLYELTPAHMFGPVDRTLNAWISGKVASGILCRHAPYPTVLAMQSHRDDSADIVLWAGLANKDEIMMQTCAAARELQVRSIMFFVFYAFQRTCSAIAAALETMRVDNSCAEV